MISNCVAGRVVRRMDETIKVCSFSCGEEYLELNSFIVEDATFYQRELLAVTYLMEDLGELIAYFSLANDRIGIEDFDSTNLYNKFRRKSFVNAKRIKHYPAVKICRLGVCEEKQQSGIGTSILDYIKLDFYHANKTGCRYLTVDAHQEAVPFYRKNGFRPLRDLDPISKEDTVLMYFDLTALKQI